MPGNSTIVATGYFVAANNDKHNISRDKAIEIQSNKTKVKSNIPMGGGYHVTVDDKTKTSSKAKTTVKKSELLTEKSKSNIPMGGGYHVRTRKTTLLTGTEKKDLLAKWVGKAK